MKPYEDDEARGKVVSSNDIDLTTARRDIFRRIMVAIEEPETYCFNEHEKRRNLFCFFFHQKKGGPFLQMLGEVLNQAEQVNFAGPKFFVEVPSQKLCWSEGF